MPRIYKGSEIEMKLLVHTCTDYSSITDLKFVFYTTNPEVAAEISEGIELNGNIATVKVPDYLFGTMEDGVINYIAQGLMDEDAFITERQSNYFLKTPASYTNSIQTKEVVYVENGEYTITPDEGFQYLNKVDVKVEIPFGKKTITENGIYDTRNGYVAKSDEEISDYWVMQGGGFVFPLGGAYNNIKMQVLFKPLNEVGEFFPNLIRGIIGSYAENFYIAEEEENPYKIFACVGDWQSEHIEITNEWHLLSLSTTEFAIDGKVVGIVPEGIDVAVTSIFLNGLDDTNTNNYYFPNFGEYSDVRIWCDDDLLFDCVFYYMSPQGGEYGYINKVDNQLFTSVWRVVNDFLQFGYTADYKLKEVRALDYIEVNVPQEGGDINPDILREITITENGRYTSKYSELIKTGEFEDGTPFYGYAELNNMSYDTGILSDNDTKVELWWCGDVTQSDKPIIGWQDLSSGNFKVSVRNDGLYTNCLNGEINFIGIQKQNLESNVWYHIELSKQEGFKINGELIGTFEDVGDVPNSNIYFNTLNGNNFANGKYGMLKINDTIFIPTENGFVNYANQEPMMVFTEGSYTYGTNYEVYEGEPYKTINVNIPPAKLQEKFEYRRDTNANFTILPDEGYDGLSSVMVSIYQPLQTKYNEGYEAGKSEGGDCPELEEITITENGTYEGAFNVVNVDVPQEGGSCDLENLEVYENGYYEPKAEEFGYLIVNENSAFDTGVKLVENSTIEIYFNTGGYDGNIPTLIGCEDADWNNTTFAVRWFSGNLSIKVGSQEISIPMGAEEEATKFHKLKFGRYEGVYLDDNYIEPFNNTEWTMNQNTIYIGAMHNTTNGDTNGVWRPWNGYIGNVKIYGEKNGEVRDFTFTCGDFGRLGEYETEGSILPNIMGEGGAIYNCCKQYGDKPFDGYSSVNVNIDVEPYKEEGRNEIRNKLQSIDITENGRYSIDETEIQTSIAFDGNSYFDTGIVPTENIKIEVCIKVTDGNDAGMGGIIIGGGIDPVNYESYEGTENRGIAIGMGGGAIYGVWGATRSWNKPYNYENTTTVVLQKTDDSWGWAGEKGSFGASTLYIGGYNKNGEEVENKFMQSIVYIKIWTDRNDDSTMTLFQPKGMAQGGFGLVNSEGTEYSYIENLGEGTTTYKDEYVRKYGEGWKEINVNVPENIGALNYQEISLSDYTALGDNVDADTIYLIN